MNTTHERELARQIQQWVLMNVDRERFSTYCGDHADFVKQGKFDQFNRAWPALSYVFVDMVADALTELGTLQTQDEP